MCLRSPASTSTNSCSSSSGRSTSSCTHRVALGGAFPVPGGGAAVAASGVSAPHRQRRGAGRARVRAGKDAGGPAGRVAGARAWGFKRRRRRSGPDARVRPEGGHRMQGGAREPCAHHRAGTGADPRVHGPLRGGGRASGSVRPHAGQIVGGEGVPARGDRGRGAGDGMGDVSRGTRDERAMCPHDVGFDAHLVSSDERDIVAI